MHIAPPLHAAALRCHQRVGPLWKRVTPRSAEQGDGWREALWQGCRAGTLPPMLPLKTNHPVYVYMAMRITKEINNWDVKVK